jgi:hypothetical protein
MSGDRIDRLCRDWLSEHYGEGTASKYRSYSLIIPMWNDAEINEALETLRQILCISFGPDESLGTTGYHKVRRKLELRDERVPIPEVFIKAFARTPG